MLGRIVQSVLGVLHDGIDAGADTVWPWRARAAGKAGRIPSEQ